jgi:hypothetical protein
MIRADINFTAEMLSRVALFEYKDNLTLKTLEDIVQQLYPGNYRFIDFVDPDVISGDSVLLITTEFDSEEDRVLLNLMWDADV